MNVSDQARQLWTIVYRLFIVVMTMATPLCVAALGLYIDKHNDERYVRLPDYAADRVRDRERRDTERLNDREMREQAGRALDIQLNRIDVALKEISGDLKQANKIPRS